MKLKELFINWLTESRYIAHLEKSQTQLRDDFTLRLAEKDGLLRQLRLELARVKDENERMRLVLMPLGSPAGALFAAKFGPQVQGEQSAAPPVSKDWNTELNKMLKEEEDGIRSGRRIQEHEPGADDGA